MPPGRSPRLRDALPGPPGRPPAPPGRPPGASRTSPRASGTSSRASGTPSQGLQDVLPGLRDAAQGSKTYSQAATRGLEDAPKAPPRPRGRPPWPPGRQPGHLMFLVGIIIFSPLRILRVFSHRCGQPKTATLSRALLHGARAAARAHPSARETPRTRRPRAGKLGVDSGSKYYPRPGNFFFVFRKIRIAIWVSIPADTPAGRRFFQPPTRSLPT